jgi:hypothetical protein
MILFSLLIEKLNSWRSWHLGGSLFISILCNAVYLAPPYYCKHPPAGD